MVSLISSSLVLSNFLPVLSTFIKLLEFEAVFLLLQS